MAYVYTSMTRAKLALNGKLPPMTPLTESARAVLDPEFTIGMGALQEGATGMLRCPVRGCGRYYIHLGRHLTISHADIGGKVAVMDALGLYRTTRLVSRWYDAARKERWDALPEDSPLKVMRRERSERMNARLEELRALGLRRWMPTKGMTTLGWRNHRSRCEAQMRAPLEELRDKLGRTPVMAEVKEGISEAFAYYLVHLYGNFNNGMRTLGFEPYDPGVSPRRRARASREHVLESLRQYHRVNGSLPATKQAQNPSRIPLIPCMETIMRALNAPTWGHAMRTACRELGIVDGRWGTDDNPIQYSEQWNRKGGGGKVLANRYQRVAPEDRKRPGQPVGPKKHRERGLL